MPDAPGPVYDSIVIGGGPAGLSAALQLARSNRQVVLVDGGSGRSTFRQVNHNYLGFPGGIEARQLREIGRRQVAMYPVAILDDSVESVRRQKNLFEAVLGCQRRIRARTMVLATGVTDDFPKVPDWQSFVGRSLFWCIVCDGYSARGKRVIAVGNHDEAAVTALQFLQFTPAVTLLTNSPNCEIPPPYRRRLRDHGVPVVIGEIAEFLGDDGILAAVTLEDGSMLEADFVFSLQGGVPNNGLARTLGAAVNGEGSIVVDDDQHTSVPGLFAAGDVTEGHAHQVATAVHQGLTAATAAQHFLMKPWQRLAEG